MNQVEIKIHGRIDEQWSEWLEDFKITHAENNEAVLTGQIADQAALYGLIAKLRDLGLSLISVNPQKMLGEDYEPQPTVPTECKQSNSSEQSTPPVSPKDNHSKT